MVRNLFKTCIAFTLLVFLLACSDPGAVNEANPLYQRGLTAAQEGRHEYAVRCFQSCLQRSPESYKAHLQLAMIFETHLANLPLAISHYEAYLDTPNADGMLNVRKLLERAKRRYYEALKAQYEPTAPIASESERREGEPPQVLAALLETPAGDAPIQEAQSFAAEKQTQAYLVRPGDNLSLISSRVYGSSRHAHHLFEANRETLRSPDRLQPGQTLIVPPLSESAGAP